MNSSAAADQDPLRLFFDSFIASADATLSHLDEAHGRLTVDPNDGEAVHAMARGFHALKGNASFFEGAAITPLARAAEEAMERLAESAEPCGSGELQLLERVVVRLRELVGESAEQQEPVAVGPREEVLVTALDAAFPGGAGCRYRFWDEDVTEEIEFLTGVADQGFIQGPAVERLLAAVRRLARLARRADVHDVARVIEAVEDDAGGGRRSGGDGGGTANAANAANAAAAAATAAGATDRTVEGVDPLAVRRALGALAPLLVREKA